MAQKLAPGLLVAAPSLQCPFFNYTVVLLVDHSDEGSFGFVVNKPSEVHFRQVLEEMQLDFDEQAPPDTPVLVGGPVSVETGWIVFDPQGQSWPDDETLHVTDGVCISASVEMLRMLASGHGPGRRLMTLGYSGWGPGQLEEELSQGSWIPVDLDPRVLFEAPAEERWSRALSTLGIDPARVSSHGSA